MPPALHKIKLLGIKDLTKDVREFTLERPEGEQHKPGQFLTVKVCDDAAQVCMRSYSVLNSPDGNNLQLVVKLVEGGRGSSWLFNLKVDETLEILYPAGRFVMPENLADELVFIGTGTGLVPLLCMLEGLPEGFEKKVKLIFGVRFKEDLYYQERIAELEKKLKNFEVIYTVSRPDDDWAGAKGRVTEHMNDLNVDAQYYVCGSGVVITDVCTHLENQGVPKDKIFHENFG